MKKGADRKRMWFNELAKLGAAPVFYIYVAMCFCLNVCLFWNGVGYKWKDLKADVDRLERNAESFAEDFYFDVYGQSDFSRVLACAKGGREYGGKTGSLIERNYARLEERAKTMGAEEQNSVSFTGAYRLHSFFYGCYIRCLMLESMLLILAVTAYILHFEKYHHTQEVVEACRYGVVLYRIKLAAAAVFSALLAAVLWLSGLGVYYAFVDYSCIWGSYISSVYHAERRTINDLYLYFYPYVTWKPMTQAGYLAETAGVAALLLLFVLLLSGILFLRFENDWKALFGLMGFIALCYLAGNLVHPKNILEFVFKFTPVHLVAKCGYWFMDYAPGDSYPAYEWLVVFVWLLPEFPLLYRLLQRRAR